MRQPRSFCVIPSVRGQSRSLPLERVLTEVRCLVNAGYREVVISGINLGRWGRDLETSSQLSALSSQGVRPRFQLLVRAILEHTSLEKLRISSVEPMDWSGELVELMATSTRIAKHTHVPLQSGSDAVLRRMHRKYRPWHYRDKIMKIRNAMPSAAIRVDVMVGFPGETDQEFNETRRMVKKFPLRISTCSLIRRGRVLRRRHMLGSFPRWSQMRETGSCATLPPRRKLSSCGRRGDTSSRRSHCVPAIAISPKL